MEKPNKNLKKLSQNMRKNMTPQELKLWCEFLKNLPVVVKRQFTIENYIVDFYIPSAKLVIEIDGSQHYEKLVEKDKIRDNKLSEFGLKVVRYSNYDVNTNFDGVCLDIARLLNIDLE